MDLIAYAVPFFLLAILAEIFIDRLRDSGYYRVGDAIASMSTGAFSSTFGLFTRVVEISIYAFVLQHFALREIDVAVFDTSPRGLAWWLAALLLWDFCYYWTHRIGHEISIFWAAHSVHHQSEDYNLSTALRQTSTGFLFGWLFYLPMFVLGIPVEVFVTVGAIDLIYQFWVHTQHIRRLGWADYVFVTPSNHRVHHAQNERYIDKNYGGILIVWDRLFGTFQEELDEDPVVFGVRKPLQSWNPFVANFHAYNYLWFDATRTRRWRDKLGVWFRRTGWRPNDVAKLYPAKAVDLARFRKFDPAIAKSYRAYVLIQFGVAVLATSAIGILYAQIPAMSALAMCAALWMLLVNLGAIDEDRSGATSYEWLRLGLVTPALGAYLLIQHGDQIAASACAAVLFGYCSLSALWLWRAQERDRF